tara:strand:+ start:379 stop:495 length:117 start_codon:yes stop_codon:yes gene_type:complete
VKTNGLKKAKIMGRKIYREKERKILYRRKTDNDLDEQL